MTVMGMDHRDTQIKRQYQVKGRYGVKLTQWGKIRAEEYHSGDLDSFTVWSSSPGEVNAFTSFLIFRVNNDCRLTLKFLPALIASDVAYNVYSQNTSEGSHVLSYIQ